MNRGENHPPIAADRFEKREAIFAPDLDVEENQVDILSGKNSPSPVETFRLIDSSDGRDALEHSAKRGAVGLAVIDNQSSHGFKALAVCATPAR
jgi:hypothetical protein